MVWSALPLTNVCPSTLLARAPIEFECPVSVRNSCPVQAFLAPANEQDFEIAPVLTEGTWGLALGDSNSWVPRILEELRRKVLSCWPLSACLFAQIESHRKPVALFGGYRLSAIDGSLWYQAHLGPDLWHLRNCLWRTFLMHTIGFMFNQQDEAPLLQLERLVA
jgi:hypothetical protein